MIISPAIKVSNSINKLEFYKIEYYDEFKKNDLEEVLTLLIENDFQKLYFSFGRYDMFYENDIEEKHRYIYEKIKDNGKIELLYKKSNDNFAFAGFFELDRTQSINLIIDIFRVYYSCSIEFFSSLDVDYISFIDLMNTKYSRKDYDNKRLYNNIKYKYSLYKGLGPDLVYLAYDNEIGLPIKIKNKIPLPPKRATSLIGRLKENIFGYPWVEE
ncbi:hypothetical protein [Aquimarina brevivitae]|uniref:Uncharacterized protein n=1 Tax=Aquimarina brevivitae TaxID=323412 RepID=A0A4Q7NYH1_9FLAO|nr:hypothetical protein [Aquimarina brevivitae]RZS92324.1 hypothetical protein EV197_2962 [Aquimarina brevivitae]